MSELLPKQHRVLKVKYPKQDLGEFCCTVVYILTIF